MFIYLQMTWIFDPISIAAAHAGGLDTSNPWWLAVHRWYLLAMLYTRVVMVLFRCLRVPAPAQTVCVILALFISPSNIGCISASCSGDTTERWMDWSQAPQPFDFIFEVIKDSITQQIYMPGLHYMNISLIEIKIV